MSDKVAVGFQIKIPEGTLGFPPGNAVGFWLLKECLVDYHLKQMAPPPGLNMDLNNCVVVVTSDSRSMPERLISLLDRMEVLDYATIVRLNEDRKTWKTLRSPDGPADVVRFVNPEFAQELDKLYRLIQTMDNLTSGQRVS